MFRVLAGFLIFLSQIQLAAADVSCFSAHPQKGLKNLMSKEAISIIAPNQEWIEQTRSALDKINPLLGPFSVRNFKVELSNEEDPLSSHHMPGEIRLGVRGQIDSEDFITLLAHEIGHEVFTQHLTKKEFIADEKMFTPYEELFGDALAGILKNDPLAMSKALRNFLDQMPAPEREKFLRDHPSTLSLFLVRSLDLRPSQPVFIPSQRLDSIMSDSPTNYQLLNKVRRVLWRNALVQLKPQDVPKFIEAYLSAAHTHRQKYSSLSIGLFKEFNRSFWELLVTNLRQAGFEVPPQAITELTIGD